MKRMIVSLLAATMLLGAAGCNPEKSPSSQIQSTTQQTKPTENFLPTTTLRPTTLPTTIPTLPTTLPTFPVTVPTLPATVPTQPTTVPTEPTTVPTQPTTVPTEPTTVPTDPTTVPTQSTTQPQPPQTDTSQAELQLGNTWEVHGCENFVNLRKKADWNAASIMEIPKGAKVECLEWTGRFAKVRYRGKVGYVMGSYLKPADENFMSAALDTVPIDEMYTYDDMMRDLIAFEQRYPGQVKLEIAGYSEWGTQIPVMLIGNENAKHHVLLHGSIHAREYFTTWLLMAMADYWLDRDLASYGDVCYHIIPMVNPDGVSIAQSGVLPEELMYIYQSDLKKGYTTDDVTTYARNWKANGQGVDLNRNYPTNWMQEDARSKPSSERYRGAEPFSAAESKALRDYTQKYPFAATISYHTTGSLIYYEYGYKQPVNSRSEALAQAVSDLTGYPMFGYNDAEPTGYKDWAIDALRIPSITVEIGSGSMPLEGRELYALFARNYHTFAIIAQWIE